MSAGDLLLFVGKRGNSLVKLILRVEAVTAEPALKRVRVDVEPLPDPAAPPPPPPVFNGAVRDQADLAASRGR